MSNPKHSFRMAPSSALQTSKTREEDLLERNAQLSKVNAQLVQEVQKLKHGNSVLVKRVVELSQKKFEACAENNRYKEVLKRIQSHITKFIPFLVKGSELADSILLDLDKVSISQNDSTQTSPVSNGEGTDDVNCGGATSASPQRTGIAMPMVKGHSISKPSISLQRMAPRQPAVQLPLPIRDLNLADMVRADTRNRDVNEVREESEQDNREANEDNSEENEPLSEESAHNSGDNDNNSRENEHSSEGNEHNLEGSEHSTGENEYNSEENGRNSGENESVRLDETENVQGNGAHNLSVVEEESSAVEEADLGQSLSQGSLHLSPIGEEDASPSQPNESSQSARQSSKRSHPEKEEVVSSDDEEVELSLIEARSRLMNGDRRKELKEGTSRDYDSKGYYSPISRRKLKRKKMSEDETLNDEGTSNETSALRKSVDGLMSSLKKSRSSRNKPSIGDSPSLVSRRVNGFVGDELDPRVSLVRMSSWRRPSLFGSGELAEECSEKMPSPKSFSPPVLLSPVDVPANVSIPPVPATPIASSPITVTKRRRCSYVTTRNKKPSLQPPLEDVAVKVEAHEVEEQPPPRRSGIKRRSSWKESIRKRNRVQSGSDTSEEEMTENSQQQTTESNSRTSVSTDELPTVVLSRCSESFIVLNSSKGLQDDSLDNSINSDTPLALLALRANSDDISSSGNLSSDKVATKTASAKRNSKTKPKSRSKPAAKKADDNDHSRKRTLSESLSAVESESHNSLNPSSLSSSIASSVGDMENSRGSVGRSSGITRPRRAKAPATLKEKSLKGKMRRS